MSFTHFGIILFTLPMLWREQQLFSLHWQCKWGGGKIIKLLLCSDITVISWHLPPPQNPAQHCFGHWSLPSEHYQRPDTVWSWRLSFSLWWFHWVSVKYFWFAYDLDVQVADNLGKLQIQFWALDKGIIKYFL